MMIFGALMGFLLLSSAGMAATAPAGAAPVPLSVPISIPTGPSFRVAMTAYNAVPEQTDSDPFTTASGAYSNPEVVAARSRDLREDLPFGTIIEFEAPEGDSNNCGYSTVSPILGYRVIADTMHQRFTKRIDVLFSTEANYVMSDGKVRNAANIFGICDGVTIRVVGHLDPKQMSKLPTTQAALAAIVTNSGKELLTRK